MIDQPTIIQTSALPAAVIRITVPRSEIREAMGPGYTELMETLAAQGITPAGAWFTHHLRMDPEVFDFYIGVPVASAVAPRGRVQPGELPAARVARTVYHGPYESLPEAWGEFDAWISAQGLSPAPGLWEVYLSGPESGADPASYRTQLSRPLA
jgi:effector-binding domain-containing protein